jgi:hypothetical protein
MRPIWVHDGGVGLLEVLYECVEVLQFEAAACIVPAEVLLSVKDVESVDQGPTIALYRRRHFGVFEVVELAEELTRRAARVSSAAEATSTP